MTLAFEKPLHPPPLCPGAEPESRETSELEISVVFTSLRATLRALKRAAQLAGRLRARITLVVPQVVPYPLPLVSPPVLLHFSERRFFAIADQAHVKTIVRIHLCRDRADCLARTLTPHSIVFLGGTTRWWPTDEARLAKKLRRMSHDVVLVESEDAPPKQREERDA